MQNIDRFGSASNSSESLPTNRRQGLPNIEIPTLNHHSSGSVQLPSGSSTPIASSGLLNITKLFSPSLRLDSPRREKYNALDNDSKEVCKGLSTTDMVKYLELDDLQQGYYNEHNNVEERKAFLHLTPNEMEACCKWRSVETRALYLKLTQEERGCYTLYASHLERNDNSFIDKGRTSDKLLNFLKMTAEERANFIRIGKRQEEIKKALITARSWEGTPEVVARRFCSDQSCMALLKDYLEKYGDDREAINELGSLMLWAHLIPTNEFMNKDQVEVWIQNHS